MAARYTLDPAQSRFSAQAFAKGFLSALGHDPTFAVREFSGSVQINGNEAKDVVVDLTARADGLDLVDQVKPADRAEIMERMRRDVLESSSFPDVRFQSRAVSGGTVAPGRYQVRIDGVLTLHGVSRPHRVDGEFRVFVDGVLLIGETTLSMSDYRIKPVSALGGAIKLKDELKLAFEIVGVPAGA